MHAAVRERPSSAADTRKNARKTGRSTTTTNARIRAIILHTTVVRARALKTTLGSIFLFFLVRVKGRGCKEFFVHTINFLRPSAALDLIGTTEIRKIFNFRATHHSRKNTTHILNFTIYVWLPPNFATRYRQISSTTQSYKTIYISIYNNIVNKSNFKEPFIIFTMYVLRHLLVPKLNTYYTCSRVGVSKTIRLETTTHVVIEWGGRFGS